ncbi:LCP family protein [Jatrophihabitans endophyticus]|uniref:LCP family protein n=1 Tax=Jatrophihabitans endophyticus TaxID=1206085 RepID=UPI001A0D9A72|nr:LCP family protein [Jatrophihabitans endophyticus]MBE7187986.1 LCP family protein [Jatrophihabitans endophyticus]
MAGPPATASGLRDSRRVRVGVRALCAALSLLVVVGSGVAWATFEKFTADVPHGAAVPALRAGEHDPDGSSQNILLIGNDTRNGATRAEQRAMHVGHDDGTVNADTMMVLHLPSNGTPPSLVSFPRDSWVSIPGFGHAKLNAAYPDGYNTAMEHHLGEKAAESAGIVMVIKSIHALTGLHIDHYMQVNLLGFYRISEAIGGVTVCLKHAQNKHTEVGDGGHGNSGIDLPKGISVIKGEQALAFVRQRHGLPQGDLDRIKRQQYFLKSAFAKITSAGVLLNPFKLRDLLEAVRSSLLTDPSLNLLDLARQMETMTTGHMDFETIPNNGSQLIYPDGVATSIVQVNKAAIPAFIRTLEGVQSSAFADARPAAPGKVTLDVLNGTDTPRLAAHNAAALVKSGFHVDDVGSAAITTSTTIEYPAGGAAAAKAVLGRVPRAKTVETPDVKRVTLVLGTNDVVAKGVAAANVPVSTHAEKHHTRSPLMKATHGLGCID